MVTSDLNTYSTQLDEHKQVTPRKSDLLERAEVAAFRSGSRLTANRRKIYEVLIDVGRPLKAYDVIDLLGGIGAQKPMTVYRSLNWLVEHGLVRKLSSAAKFVVVFD